MSNDIVEIPKALDKRVTLELISRIKRGWIPNYRTRRSIESAITVLNEETKFLKAYIERKDVENKLTKNNLDERLAEDDARIKAGRLDAENYLASKEREKQQKEKLDHLEESKIELETMRVQKELDRLNGKGEKKLSKNEGIIKSVNERRELIKMFEKEMQQELMKYEDQVCGRLARQGINISVPGFKAIEHMSIEELREYENIVDHYKRAKAEHC